MKKVEIEYPDKSIHNTIVTELGYIKKLDKYLIHYYDLTEGDRMVTILEKRGDNFVKIPRLDGIDFNEIYRNYEERDETKLPKHISCEMYENSKKIEKQTVIVEVYKKNNENFLATSICSKLHIKPESDKYKIKGIECYKISDLLLHQIERYENATQRIVIKPVECEFAYQEAAEFLVYQTEAGQFVLSEICRAFGVGDNTVQITIGGQIYNRVTQKDIQTIVRKSEEGNPCLKPRYINISKKTASAFKVYVDINNNNELYVDKSLCEIFKITSNKVKTIENISCYRVTKENVKEIENKSRNTQNTLVAFYKEVYLGKEIEYKERNTKTQTQTQKAFIYYNDINNKKLYITRNIYELAKNLNVPVDGKPKVIEGKNCYSIKPYELQELEKKSFLKGIEKIVYLEKVKEDIIVYVDKTTNKYFIIDNNESNTGKIIVGRKCKEITEEYLNSLVSDSKNNIIKVTVYLNEDNEDIKNINKNIKITICELDKDLIFIPEDYILMFNLNPERRKIRVDGTIYYQTDETTLAVIKHEASKQGINIIYDKKDIVPTNNTKKKIEDEEKPLYY